MKTVELVLGLIGRLDERDASIENDILRKKEGVELVRDLTRYLFGQWYKQIQLRRVSIGAKQRPDYTADDWQDWKIIEDLREDEIY